MKTEIVEIVSERKLLFMSAGFNFDEEIKWRLLWQTIRYKENRLDLHSPTYFTYNIYFFNFWR